MRRLATLVLGISLIVVLCVVAYSQSRPSGIRGSVKDPAGTALTGASVTLSQGSSTVKVVVTDAGGEFRFADLPPGTYEVSVALEGFRKVLMTVTVRSGMTEQIAVGLEVGRLDDAVVLTPTAEAEQRSALPSLTQLAAVSSARKATASVMGGAYPASSPQRFNTESYNRIDDNQWSTVAQKPLSTFSIDVDTASYANVRRFLNQGQVPPKDAVRVEELINYFAYEYPKPAGATPFSITTALADCPWDARHKLALVGLQAKRIDRAGTPPRNLVFLVDVSGSMEDPQKLPLVKSSLAMLARNLTSADRIAIAVYAGAAGVVLPSTPGSDTSAILDALGRLEAGGSTNGAEGLTLAYQAAQAHFIKGGVNRVILATDGDFNVGVTSEGDLVRLIEEKRAAGITLSVLGFGMGNLKDSTMEKLADRGNGNYAYIDSLSEAQKVLVDEIGGTLVTVAKDVKMQIEFNPRVAAAYRLIGYENRMLEAQDFNDDRKDAGEMGAGHSVTALYEIVPAGQPLDLPGVDPLRYQQVPVPAADAPRNEMMNVKVRFKQPDGDVSSLVSTTVSTNTSSSAELGFAAAVAEFGMLLRDSEYKGKATFADARQLAERNRGDDPFGHRAEFIRLVGLAESLVGMRHSSE